MPSIKDVEQVADDLEALVGEMRQELKDGADFAKMVSIADRISEHADDAAQTFNSVNDALMARLNDIGGGKRSSSGSREKQSSSSS